jgi:hypothetical protein
MTCARLTPHRSPRRLQLRSTTTCVCISQFLPFPGIGSVVRIHCPHYFKWRICRQVDQIITTADETRYKKPFFNLRVNYGAYKSLLLLRKREKATI